MKLLSKVLAAITWSALKPLPSNRYVAASYIWLVIVPVAGKVLSKLEAELSFELAGQAIVFVMDLPFSWFVFYFSALAFTVANIVFVFSCPKLVREYDNFHHFVLSGGNKQELTEFLTSDEKEVMEISGTLSNKSSGQFLTSQEADNFETDFWEQRGRADQLRPILRLVTFLFYVLGFTGGSVVLFDNLNWVLRNGAF